MARIKNEPKEDIIPLPISVTGSSGITHWYLSWKNWLFSRPSRPTGIYVDFGKFVWIQQEDHQLYQQGYFGKGTLSRSDPTWYSRLQQAHSQQQMAPEQVTAARRKQRKQQRRMKAQGQSVSFSVNQPVDESESFVDDQRSLQQLADWTQMENQECFQLDLFEAFFLVYGIDVLDIQDKEQRLLSIEDCWNLFSHAFSCQLQPWCQPPLGTSSMNMYAVNYIAYHYYRSQGWVPKDGLKFGVNFVLYQLGPKYRHAEFAVLVIPCIMSTTEHHHKQQQDILYNWTHLLRINRICSQVKKTLVLCYVTLPPSDICDTWHLSIMNHCTVRQVILKRWSPESNRD
ncbi:uncharacterized protein BX664DRAFT_289704 [Halteromyces radiatus]|uniref:uncharacterized protein n=1 Tax=Halteromyces radiatus TaxID=101107 RepID=UPI00221E6810|nr:uncharacterized protein BX664DRAFT_289704 [Halteromyces radiatus]KAI8099558.1 hypothetical protein BX664DRAFT_289704 [Halteromyces radiatus]